MIYGTRLSAIRAAAARDGLEDLDLFAGTGVLGKVPDKDDAISAGVRALVLIGVEIMISGSWVRGCARLLCGHEDTPSWSVPPGSLDPPAGASLCHTYIVSPFL
jgi:hypothetical protein